LSFKKFKCPNHNSGCAYESAEINVVGEHLQNCAHKVVVENSKPNLAFTQSVAGTKCKTCHQLHAQLGTTANRYHTGTFHGLDYAKFIREKDKNAEVFTNMEKAHTEKVGGESALHFCGRVACKSACHFGKDTAVCAVASGKAGLYAGGGTTIGAAVVLGIATSPVGGAGVIVAPVIGVAVGLVVAIGGTVGGMLIGAGHAIATPFIELGRGRKPGTIEQRPGALVPWSCCGRVGSWALGCEECTHHH